MPIVKQSVKAETFLRIEKDQRHQRSGNKEL